MRWINWRAGVCAGVMAVGVGFTPAWAGSGSEAALVEAASTIGAGEYSWNDAGTSAGPVRVLVSIPFQRLFVYRGAKLIAVSTGSAGHETPVGEFTILQKAVTHRSNRYDDAKMPYMQRLTWDGVAIHAGRDPGYAASHGCVRVPLAFAKKLYAVTSLGAHVSVSDEESVPGMPDLVPPSPVDQAMASAAANDPETDATRLANLAQHPETPARPTASD